MISPEEMRIRAAEEVAQEFTSAKQAPELMRRISEYGIKICAPRGVSGSTLEDRLKYKAMYLRLKEFDQDNGEFRHEMIFFVDIDEDAV